MDIKAVGINVKDIYILAGKVNTKDTIYTLEFSGVVKKEVGLGVTDIKLGGRVIIMVLGHFKTTEIIPRWAYKKL